MFTNKMIWQIDEYMLYCQSKQLSEKTMESYEQTLHLFERWCGEEMLIENVTEITEEFIRRYINDLQTRVWGDRIFEKCGIGRDEGGDGGKTLEIRGKRRLSARDGGANYQQS